jgi:predicted glycosyltransferase
MFYSHDSYGLGHVRRTVTLAHHFRATWPEVGQLVVTGTPAPHACRLPEGAEWIKLPSVVKVGKEEYESRILPIEFEEIRALRRDMLLSAVEHFHPDVLLVDHAPDGLKGELVATLGHLVQASPATRLVVGLRDIVDEPRRVRRSWSAAGVYALLDDVYDLILVYGDEAVYDLVAEYGVSEEAAAKTRYVGYLGRGPANRPAEEVRAELDLTSDRLVLVTAGGGGDGFQIFRAVLGAQSLASTRARSKRPPFDCVLVGGPLMDDVHRQSLTRLLPPGSSVRFVDFVEELVDYIAAADIVVSMCGYNSVCEILSFERPAIIVPRVTPRKEQLIRAKILSRRGLARMILPDQLTPRHLLWQIDELLERPVRKVSPLRLNGLQGVTAELEELLGWTVDRALLGRTQASRG